MKNYVLFFIVVLKQLFLFIYSYKYKILLYFYWVGRWWKFILDDLVCFSCDKIIKVLKENGRKSEFNKKGFVSDKSHVI